MPIFDISTLYQTKHAGSEVIAGGVGLIFNSIPQETSLRSITSTYQIRLEKRGTPSPLLIVGALIQESDDPAFITGVVNVEPPFVLGDISKLVGNFDAFDGTINLDIGLITTLRFSRIHLNYSRAGGGNAPIFNVYLQTKKPVLPPIE